MTLFENLLQVSLTGGFLIALAMALSLLMGQRMAARYKRLIWIVVAVRLLIPFTFSMPQAPVQVPMPDLRSPVRVTAQQAPTVMNAVPVQQPQTLAAQSQDFSWLTALCAVWGLGTAVFLLHLALSQRYTVRRLRRWSREANADAYALLAEMQGALGIKRKVALRRSGEVRTPMLLGIFRPVILLPHAAYDDEDLAMILRHELTHLKSGDIWFKALMLIARAIHWFNPLVHMMVRRAETDMEFACDDAVVRALGAGQGRRYGETILAAASMGQGRAPALSTHFLSTKKNLAQRILNIMQRKKRRVGVVALVAVLLVTMVGGMVVSFATGGSDTAPIVQEIYGRLFELRPDDYAALSVTAFREAVHGRMEADEAAYLALYDVHNDEAVALRYSDEGASFLFNTLIPLTAEKWQSWRFANAIAHPMPQDYPPAEYAFTTEILDADALTVGDYESRLRGFMGDMEQLITEQLAAPTLDQAALQPAVQQIEQAYSDEGLRFTIQSIYGLNEEAQSLPEEEPIAPVTQSDVDLLLALRPDGYRDLSVATFNDGIQEAFRDEDSPLHEAYQRLRGNQPLEDALPGVSPDDLSFLSGTLEYSVREFVAENQAPYSETPVYPVLQQFYFGDASEDNVVMEYDLAYQVLGGAHLTVGMRDDALQGVLAGMAQAMAEGVFREGEAALSERLDSLCATQSLPGLLEIFPEKVYMRTYPENAALQQSAIGEIMQALMALDSGLPLTEYRRQVEALCMEAGTSIYEVLSEAQSFFDDPDSHAAAVLLMNTSSEMFAEEMGGEERSFASDTVRREKELSLDEELEALRDTFSPEELAEIRKSMQDDPRSLAYLVQVNYIILYDILAPDVFTAAQREARLTDVKQALYAFMDSLSEEELLDAGLAARVEALFGELAATYSDDEMRVAPELQQIDGFGPDGLDIIEEV